MNVKIVHADDWEALYVDGLLYRTGHKIEPADICSAVIKFSMLNDFSYDEKWIDTDDKNEFEFPVHYERLGI